MSFPNLIIDTDVGVDDAVALALALTHPGTNVHAVTTVFGNVSNAQAGQNVATILQYFGKPEIPIYSGYSTLLLGAAAPEGWPGHGKNGMGDHEFYPSAEEQAALPKIRDEHAVDALIRMVRERPGFYDILALGPLTNIAAACQREPAFGSLVRSLVWMGGSAIARGNSSRTAEFNAHADPDAAAVVFASFPARVLTMVPWEATVDGGFPMPAYRRLTGNADNNRLAFFMRAILRVYEQHCERDVAAALAEETHMLSTPPARAAKCAQGRCCPVGVVLADSADGKPCALCAAEAPAHVHTLTRLTLCDAVAFLAMAAPADVVTAVSVAPCTVETGADALGRGAIAVDWYGRHCSNAPARIVRGVRLQAVLDLFADACGVERFPADVKE